MSTEIKLLVKIVKVMMNGKVVCMYRSVRRTFLVKLIWWYQGHFSVGAFLPEPLGGGCSLLTTRLNVSFNPLNLDCNCFPVIIPTNFILNLNLITHYI